MKINSLKNHNRIIKGFLIATLFCVFILSAIFAVCFSKKASATGSVSPTPVLPVSKIENNALTDPKQTVYLDDGRVATIQGDDLVFYLTDGTVKTIDGFTSLKQLKVFGDGMLVSNAGSLYLVDTVNYTYSQLTYDNGGVIESVGGNYFDLNENYLITAYGNNLTVYSYDLTSGAEITYIRSFGAVKGDCPIAINQSGTVFYHSNGDPRILYARNLSTLDITEISEMTVTDIIANDQYIYYIYGAKIYRRNLQTPTVGQLLEIKSSLTFDLGRLPSPVSLSFKGENLLITDDVLCAAQEFTVKADGLYFTGYAVASGKTAFNRIGINAFATDLSGDSFVAIDDVKLTLVKKLSGDLYAESNFTNLFLTDLNGALGFTPDTVLVADDVIFLANKEDKAVALLSFDGQILYSYNGFTGNNLTDACAVGGKIYIAKIGGGLATDTEVYTLSNKTVSGEPELLFTAESGFGAGTLISADIYGNVYLTDRNGYVYRSDDFTTSLNDDAVDGVIKTAVDFAGNPFLLTENSVFYVKDGTPYEIPITGGNVKSFALSFDKKDVYFTVNAEKIYKTNLLPNLAADDVNIPQNFKTSGTTADVDTFMAVSVDKATVGISAGDVKFNYLGLLSGYTDEYVCVCETELTATDTVNGNDLSLSLYVLLGKNQHFEPSFYLVNKALATDITATVKTEPTLTEVYVTTDVNAYYLPMIADGDFLLTDGDNALRLAAKTELTVLNEIVFAETGLNEKFYYVGVENSAGETVYGYIPQNFTVDELSEQKNGETVVSQIKNKHDNSFRNSLIIIALSASVFGTSIFFILKRKSS